MTSTFIKIKEESAVISEIAALEDLDRTILTDRWRQTFGGDPPPRLSRALMIKALAYEIQAQAHGALSSRAIRALKAAARSEPNGPSARPPARGARLIREWHGVLHEVDVLDEGYLWQGERYRSLSAIAGAITGAKWSGPRFFGTRGNG